MFLKAFASLLVLAGIGFSAAATDDAAHTLSTPQQVVIGEHSLDCFLTNVSDVSHAVAIHVVNAAGQDVSLARSARLEPGIEIVNTAHASLAPRSCRFVVDGESADFLGTAVVREPNGRGMTAIEAQ